MMTGVDMGVRSKKVYGHSPFPDTPKIHANLLVEKRKTIMGNQANKIY